MRIKVLQPGCIFVAILIVSQLVISAHAYRIEYEYDSLDRLTKVIHPGGETVNYTYDPVGNRIRKEVAIGPVLVPPTLVASVVANGQTQRSTVRTISAQFSEDVTITSDALSIIGQSHGSIDLTGAVFDYNSVSFTATWTMSQSLPDDKYTATLDASKITDSDGQNLDGNGDGTGGDDATFEFYRLFGDATGDAVVDFVDLSLFVSRWLNTPSDSGLDADSDNFVNFSDFASFAQNWLKDYQ